VALRICSSKSEFLRATERSAKRVLAIVILSVRRPVSLCLSCHGVTAGTTKQKLRLQFPHVVVVVVVVVDDDDNNKCTNLSHQFVFHPIAVETQGPLNESARGDLLKDVGR